MTRGKQGAAAAIRRDWAALEARAVQAERARDKAQDEASRLSEQLQVKTESWIRLERELRQQIADATSGQVDDLLAMNEQLRSERDKLLGWMHETRDRIQPQLVRMVKLAYKRLGVDSMSAFEAIGAVVQRNPDLMVIERSSSRQGRDLPIDVRRVIEGRTGKSSALRDELVAEALADEEIQQAGKGATVT